MCYFLYCITFYHNAELTQEVLPSRVFSYQTVSLRRVVRRTENGTVWFNCIITMGKRTEKHIVFTSSCDVMCRKRPKIAWNVPWQSDEQNEQHKITHSTSHCSWKPAAVVLPRGDRLLLGYGYVTECGLQQLSNSALHSWLLFWPFVYAFSSLIQEARCVFWQLRKLTCFAP